jgi:hypothetical protein
MISDRNLETASVVPDARRLATLERIIEAGLATFIGVGNALAAIRDERLYRANHTTFERYCKGRWQMGRHNANELIRLAAVAENLGEISPKPTIASQVRPLVDLEPEQQREAWKKATETTANPTAKQVEAAITKERIDPFADALPEDPDYFEDDEDPVDISKVELSESALQRVEDAVKACSVQLLYRVPRKNHVAILKAAAAKWKDIIVEYRANSRD